MAVIQSENFTSAPNFTAVGTALAVTGGRCRPSVANTDCGGYANTDMGTSDHYVQADLITTSDITDVYVSVVARWDGIDTNLGGDGYVFQQNFGDAVLYGANSSSFENLATIANAFATPGTYTLRLEVNGNQISAKINGAHIAGSPFTSTFVTAGTKAGMTMFCGSTVADSEVDNFEAGNFNADLFPALPLVINRPNLRR